MLTAALASLAIVTQNPVALRAAPHDNALQQAVLWQGEALEVRGRHADYLQVYDHRLERGGYVKASQVGLSGSSEADAPQLLAVTRFLRDVPGSEALAIGYAAAWIQAAPARTLDAEAFDTLGTLADRLARRASNPATAGTPAQVSAWLDIAASYGLPIHSVERDGKVTLCYEGEMFRRVLAQPAATPDQKARAALGLTREDCVDPAMSVGQAYEFDRWRADVLDRVPVSGVDPLLTARLHVRRASVFAALAFAQTRRGEQAGVLSGRRAVEELAAVVPTELGDEDLVEHSAAAVRVGANRWTAEPSGSGSTRLQVQTLPGETPGETCVVLTDARHDTAHALARRCTFGLVWSASASVNPQASALALAVQPMSGWRELWLFRRQGEQWAVDVLPPSTASSGEAYLEAAGWTPAGDRLLTARESWSEGRWQRRFEVLRTDTLAVEKGASTPDLLLAFGRYQDPAWKRGSVALR